MKTLLFIYLFILNIGFSSFSIFAMEQCYSKNIKKKDVFFSCGLQNGCLFLISTKTNKVVGKYHEHEESIEYMVVLPDGRLVTSSRDCPLKIWKFYKNNDKISLLNINNVKTIKDSVSFLLVLPDNKLAISSFYDKSVKIIDTNSWKCIQELKGHDEYVTSIDCLSSRYILTGSNDTTIKIWDIFTGKCVCTLIDSESPSWVKFLSYNDGELCSLSVNGILKKYSLFLHKGSLLNCVFVNSIKFYFNNIFKISKGKFIMTKSECEGDFRDRYWKHNFSVRNFDSVFGVAYNISKDFISCVTELPNGNIVIGSFDGKLSMFYYEKYNKTYLIYYRFDLMEEYFRNNKNQYEDYLINKMNSLSLESNKEEIHKNNVEIVNDNFGCAPCSMCVL